MESQHPRKRHRSTSPPSTPPTAARSRGGSPLVQGQSPGATRRYRQMNLSSIPPLPYPTSSYGPVGNGGHMTESDASAVRAARVQVLQDVLRRTSLTELRDREIVEWLTDTEAWLQKGEAAFLPPSAAPSTRVPNASPSPPPQHLAGSSTPSAATVNCHFSGAAELRLLVLGVLHTMPWWRVVESVAEDDVGGGRSARKLPPPPPAAGAAASVTEARADPRSTGAGKESGMQRANVRQPASAAAVAAARAVTRWHEKIQVGFERVCLVLVEQSQHTVPGVLEVVMKPFHLRPPVRDGAQRAIPTDSFLRIMNAIATTYSASYTLELFPSCLDSLLPKRRWPDRRHHLASTAMLLHLALESVIPAFQPNTGNAHCLEHARELMVAAETAAAVATAAAEEQSDVQLKSTEDVLVTDELNKAQNNVPLAEDTEGEGVLAPLQLPVSTRRVQEVQQQPPPSSSDVDMSDTASTSSSSNAPPLHRSGTGGGSERGGGGRGNKSAFVAVSCNNNNNLSATPRTMLAQMPSQLKAAVAAAAAGAGRAPVAKGVAHGWLAPAMAATQNNRMLSCRADIIRFLLWRLLDMELSLEGDSVDDGQSLLGDEGSDAASLASTSFSGIASSNPWWAPLRRRGGGGVSGGTRGTHHAESDAHAPKDAQPPVVATHPPSVSQRSTFSMSFSPLLNRQSISEAARPFLHILSDCTQLTFLMLAEDLRRQQAAGVCGNTEWWREIVTHFLSAVRRVDRPKCLVFLAPSLALLGEGDQPVDLLHKLVSLVTKGYMPALGPSIAGSTTGFADRLPGGNMGSGSGLGAMASHARGMGQGIGTGSALPMRMRAAHPASSSLSAHPIPMQERLRAAMFIFPLFLFMREKLSSAEGARRRMMKWVTQEMRRHYVGGGGGPRGSALPSTPSSSALGPRPSPIPSLLREGGSTSSVGSRSLMSGVRGGGGSPSGSSGAPSRLVAVVFAQCAAMSAVMAQQSPPSEAGISAGSPPTTPPLACTKSSPSTADTTLAAVSSGSLQDAPAAAAICRAGWCDEALRPLVEHYTLPAGNPAAEGQGDDTLEQKAPLAEGQASGVATDGEAAPDRLLDLGKMEHEGLLRPCLMEGCMWEPVLRQMLQSS